MSINSGLTGPTPTGPPAAAPPAAIPAAAAPTATDATSTGTRPAGPRPAGPRLMRLLTAAVVGLTAGALLVGPVVAQPVKQPVPLAAQPGPALRTPVGELVAALSCVGALESATRTPVLLVHGTSSTPEESWAFGYGRVLPARGHPTCAVRLPDRAWNDIQTSTEYVVHAVRTIAARSGRRVTVIGHSQGALQPLWALRFWPDLADQVEDFVGLAAPLRGTVAASVVCALPGRCPEVVWQYGAGSAFVAALNRRRLPTGPSYTVVATLNDELVVPQPVASTAPGVSTIVVQRVCPGRFVEHVGLLADAVAHAIVLDALDHPGPAVAGRISPATCFHPLMPGVDAAGYLAALPVFVANFAGTALTADWVDAEPPLREYARIG